MEQKTIKQGGSTTGSECLREIRNRFEARLAQLGSFDDLKNWLQAPVSPDGRADGNCEPRAKDLAAILKSNDTTKAAYVPDLRSAIGTTFEKKWEFLDKQLAEQRVLVMKGPAAEIGGSQSVFKMGHHVVLFLGRITREPKIIGVPRRSCYIGFDPDISATEDSRKAWQALLDHHKTSSAKVKDLAREALCHIVKAMILGEGIAGVGPLIRKYYPDTTKGLGEIKRF